MHHRQILSLGLLSTNVDFAKLGAITARSRSRVDYIS